MSIIFIIFAAIVVLGPLVALHELGHFWVARKLGVKVLTYSIGFGPVVFNRKGKDGVDYRLSLIPLGGYVRMLDEREAPVAKEEQHLAFNRQHPLKKIAIVAAGPLMNFIIAIILFWVLLLPASEQLSTKIGKLVNESPAQVAGLVVGDTITAINGKPTDTWGQISYAFMGSMGETTTIAIDYTRNDQSKTTNLAVTNFLNGKQADLFKEIGFYPYTPVISPTIDIIQANSAAANQGMQQGDTVIAINGKKITTWHDMGDVIGQNPEKLLVFTVMRNGKPVDLKIMPQGKADRKGNIRGVIGVSPAKSAIKIPKQYKKIIQYSPLQALQKAIIKTYDLSVITLQGMGKMIAGLIGLDNLSGPITIAKMAGETMSIGWQAVLSYMGLISVSLAVLNLLPIPVLDGGHLLYYTYELIAGKPLPEKTQMLGLRIGLAIMLLLMILAITNDITRLF